MGAARAIARGAGVPARAFRDAYRVYHPPPGNAGPAARGRTPGARGLPVRPARIATSRDGLRLDAWVVPGVGPHTVVVCHGMGRTKSSVLGHVRMLHDAGHHVLAYDLRNHGESGRDRSCTAMAARFTSDLADVIRYARADATLGGGRLGILAFSFSTWPAIYVLREPGLRVSAVVCDSGPFHVIRSGFGHYSRLRRDGLPDGLRGERTFAAYRALFTRLAGRMLAVGQWPPVLPAPPTPMLFVAGGEDVVVPPEQVRPVAERYHRAQFWVAPNAMHMSALRADRAEYEARVTGFLAGAFRRAEPGSPVASAEARP